jgi:hypothetical protein
VFGFLFLLLLPGGNFQAHPAPKMPFLDRLFYATVDYLNLNHERAIIRNGKRYLIPDQNIEMSIFYCWEASAYNPGWWGKYDGRKLGCIRLLMAHYGETAFNLRAVNSENADGSVDIGPMQVNSCHWFSAPKSAPWSRFCKLNGLDQSKIWTIANPRNNFRFAALLNEKFIKSGQRTYHYDGRPRQIRFYCFLLKKMGMSQELAEYEKKMNNNLNQN